MFVWITELLLLLLHVFNITKIDLKSDFLIR